MDQEEHKLPIGMRDCVGMFQRYSKRADEVFRYCEDIENGYLCKDDYKDQISKKHKEFGGTFTDSWLRLFKRAGVTKKECCFCKGPITGKKDTYYYHKVCFDVFCAHVIAKINSSSFYALRVDVKKWTESK